VQESHAITYRKCGSLWTWGYWGLSRAVMSRQGHGCGVANQVHSRYLTQIPTVSSHIRHLKALFLILLCNFFSGGSEVWIYDLLLARQVLCHLNHFACYPSEEPFMWRYWEAFAHCIASCQWLTPAILAKRFGRLRSEGSCFKPALGK
jgi:hypothetical protein